MSLLLMILILTMVVVVVVQLYHSMFGAFDDMVVREDGRLYNTRAKTFPPLVHYNGMAKGKPN